MPDFLNPQTAVLRSLLERNAREAPDELFVTFEDGSSWTRLEALRQAGAAANELRRAGVARDDAVAAALPNGAAFFRAWWGAAFLGAAIVPVSLAYRSIMIRRMLDVAKPAAVVAGPEFRQRLKEAGVPAVTTLLDPSDLIGTDFDAPALSRPIRSWDVACLAVTSGTTGPSKVVRVSHAHSANGAYGSVGRWGLGPADVYLCDLPMAHVGGLYTVHAAIDGRTRIAVRTRPALDAYWEVARDTGATVSQLYSTMVSYVDAQQPRGTESDHRLRLVVTLPLPPNPAAFQKKFNIPQLTIGWGSTEIGAAVGLHPGDDVVPGSTGRVFAGWEVRLVDEHDMEVPVGTPGHAIVRHDSPWVITTAYIGDPEATAQAWRNGWFHTGDLLRVDEDGNYYFVDRVKDSLRRRGQNISSFEVETVVQTFPDVLEAAVVPERADAEVEDEVKGWVVLTNGCTSIDFALLLRHCAENLPHYRVPRYFEVAPELPKTPSGKVRKHLLRECGNSGATWDRRSHGLDVTRRGVETLAIPPGSACLADRRSPEPGHRPEKG